MKKIIITVITTCIAMYAALWPRNAEDEVNTRHTGKTVITADVEATQIESPNIIFSSETQSPDPAGTKGSTGEKEQTSSLPNEAKTTSDPEPTSTPSPSPKPGASSTFVAPLKLLPSQSVVYCNLGDGSYC